MVHDDPNIASYIVILKSNHAWYNLSLNLFLSFSYLGGNFYLTVWFS